ncbi:MAG: hypothetical protein FWG42_02775 [Clostridiales bacterium]|nr:hypothetical protein [Clostridiales bacterium]
MKTNKWFWGIFFVCAAAAVILNALGYLANVSLLSIIFAVVLIPVIVESVLHRNFAGIFFPLALVGILFSKPLQIEALSPWPLLVAALFLSIAFSTMFRKRRFREYFKHHRFYHEGKSAGSYEGTVEYLDDEEIECGASFCASTKYIHCDNLRKAKIYSSFGALKIFFDNAKLDPSGAVMDVDCSFGAIEMYVPKSWRIENRIVASLGAVEMKNKCAEDAQGPKLTLNGRVSLGAVNIVYV